MDKLTNYLRFWQASGGSEKTSIRIRNKMQQMALGGMYTGGPVRFGYRLVESGMVNRKNIPIKKYEIDPAEREVLQMIDDMTIHKGYGSYRMADYLNQNGSKFTSIKIIRILRNPYYCGKLEDGTTSEQLQAMFRRQIAGNRATQKKLETELVKNREQLTKLQLEIGKTLTGESIYSPEELSQAIRTIKERVAEAGEKLEALKSEEAQKKQCIDMITPAYNQFKSWAEEFDTATLEQEK